MALVVKNLLPSAGDLRVPGLNPGWGRFPGEGNGNPLEYYCVENPMDNPRGAWLATVYRDKELDMTEATYHARNPLNTEISIFQFQNRKRSQRKTRLTP